MSCGGVPEVGSEEKEKGGRTLEDGITTGPHPIPSF